MTPEATIPALAAIIPASEKEITPSPAARVVVDLFKRPVAVARDGFNASIGQSRAERSAEQEKQRIAEGLQTLEIEKKLREELLLRLPGPGYQLVSDFAENPVDTGKHHYTALRRNGMQAALLQLPPEVFKTDNNDKELYIGDFTMMLKAFRGKKTRLFSEGIAGITDPFQQAIDDERRGGDCRFINWTDVKLLTQAKRAFWRVFSLQDPADRQNSRLSKALSEAELGRIAQAIARFAQHNLPVENAFLTLVLDSGWPKEWKDARSTGWTGNAQGDAQVFVQYMLWKGTFPAGHELVGRSVLGEFLRRFLERGALGGDDADSLARIVVEYALVPDPDTFRKYYLP